MPIPEWAQQVIELHSMFREAGIEIEVEWNEREGRVDATCKDVEAYTFPARSWYTSKDVWKKGTAEALLRNQLDYLEEYFNAN